MASSLKDVYRRKDEYTIQNSTECGVYVSNMSFNLISSN
jgi:hypothetical protein